jgi:hypothetical protein
MKYPQQSICYEPVQCQMTKHGYHSKEKVGIPRRRKPIVQQQSHRVPMLQAEHREQGWQKLDNQEWRRCLHNSG